MTLLLSKGHFIRDCRIYLSHGVDAPLCLARRKKRAIAGHYHFLERATSAFIEPCEHRVFHLKVRTTSYLQSHIFFSRMSTSACKSGRNLSSSVGMRRPRKTSEYTRPVVAFCVTRYLYRNVCTRRSSFSQFAFGYTCHYRQFECKHESVDFAVCQGIIQR